MQGRPAIKVQVALDMDGMATLTGAYSGRCSGGWRLLPQGLLKRQRFRRCPRPQPGREASAPKPQRCSALPS